MLQGWHSAGRIDEHRRRRPPHRAAAGELGKSVGTVQRTADLVIKHQNHQAADMMPVAATAALVMVAIIGAGCATSQPTHSAHKVSAVVTTTTTVTVPVTVPPTTVPPVTTTVPPVAVPWSPPPLVSPEAACINRGGAILPNLVGMTETQANAALAEDDHPGAGLFVSAPDPAATIDQMWSAAGTCVDSGAFAVTWSVPPPVATTTTVPVCPPGLIYSASAPYDTHGCVLPPAF